MANTFFGILLMLFSTSIMNLGFVTQKKAVDNMPPMEHQTLKNNLKSVLSNKLWMFGWVCFFIAIILNMVALSQAYMSITQPLIGFGLVVLILLSHFYLGEKITRNEIIGIIIAVIGVIIMGIFATASRIFSMIDEILDNIIQPKGILCIILFYAVAMILWIWTAKQNYKFGGIIFAIITALFSVMGLVFSKGLFTILDLAGFALSFSYWQAYILLLLVLINQTIAVATQQLSFQKGKAVVVTPVFNLASIILPLITGAMIFGEAITLPKIIATIIIIIGAVFLSIKKEE